MSHDFPSVPPPYPSRILGSAEISACGRYRYELTRSWDAKLPTIAFVMLNPSTADAAADDPTIRRCIGFANSWGFGELRVYNLFGLRASDPSAIPMAAAKATAAGTMDGGPVGAENDEWLRKACECKIVLCAWGSHTFAVHRAVLVATTLQRDGGMNKLCALRLSQDGMPAHPLYIPAKSRPFPFTVVPLKKRNGGRR